MFDAALAGFLEAPGAMIIGTVDARGVPHAGRAWGAHVLSDPSRVRMYVGADDRTTIENLSRDGTPVALTQADVRTLQSLQVKGRVLLLEPATEADEVRCRASREALVQAIQEADQEPIELLRRWTDHPIVACEFEVESTFDQTPGPSAGTPTGGATR